MCHFDELKNRNARAYGVAQVATRALDLEMAADSEFEVLGGMRKTSFMPPRRHSDSEYVKWQTVPRDLKGKHVSLDELEALFPEDDRHSGIKVIREDERHAIYGHTILTPGKYDFTTQLAYGCKTCNGIFVGHPVIVDENSIGIQPLAGREGYDANCIRCHSRLYESTWKVS